MPGNTQNERIRVLAQSWALGRLTPHDADRYSLEPYLVAADVYSTAPHEGRGGWTGYIGPAGWIDCVGTDGLLGLSWAETTLRLNPSFPKDWPEMTATVTLEDTVQDQNS